MRRIPVFPTLLVLLAAAAMVWLGFWQLQRRQEKEALLAAVAANPARPSIGFPRAADDRLLFRRTVADCAAPVAVTRAGAGNAGFRLIAHCADGTTQVQLGTTRDPMAMVTWDGGRVTGWISHAPDARPLIARAFDHTPTPLLLVSDRPLAGLAANTRPDAGLIPNNHLAYAVQWFIFAVLAVVIYALALVRRTRSPRP